MLRDILEIKREYIEISLKSIKDNYGNYERYFEKEFGLGDDDIENLKNVYLYLYL